MHRTLIKLACLCLCLLVQGCASGGKTELSLRGGPHGPATFQFRDVFWRASPDGGSNVEIIGLGFAPFRNDPGSRNYNSHWPTSGFVKFWLHLVPRSDHEYAVMILGPAKMLGPGDDEVLSGESSSVVVEPAKDENRVIRISEMSIRSRNKPDTSFTLSGAISAKKASQQEFSGNLRQFTEEFNSRQITH